MPSQSILEAVRNELRRQTTGPVRLRRQFFSPRRELRRIERRHRRLLREPALELSRWDSHQPVLLELLGRLERPRVLELGVGYGSTPIVLVRSGYSVSLETDEDWVARFLRFDSSVHRVLPQRDFDEMTWTSPFFDQDWDIAFIDNSPARTRQGNLLKLADKARFLVCHDTEECFKPSGSSYGWDFSEFAYVWTYTRFENYTTVASNVEAITLAHLGGVSAQPPGPPRPDAVV